MENDCERFLTQIRKAKETLCVLENDLYDVRTKLKANPSDAGHLKTLKRVTLEMTITLNEIEHNQALWEQCKTKPLQAEQA